MDGYLRSKAFHVVVADHRHPKSSIATVHRVRGLREQDGRQINGVPVTSIERTLIDAAALVGAEELDGIVDAVVRQQLTTIQRFESKSVALAVADGRA